MGLSPISLRFWFLVLGNITAPSSGLGLPTHPRLISKTKTTAVQHKQHQKATPKKPAAPRAAAAGRWCSKKKELRTPFSPRRTNVDANGVMVVRHHIFLNMNDGLHQSIRSKRVTRRWAGMFFSFHTTNAPSIPTHWSTEALAPRWA